MRRARSPSIASLRSVTWTAFTGVAPATSGSSANVPPKVVGKVAVVDRATVIATAQRAAVPVQAPLQPPNVAPPAATAVSVTLVPGANAAAHAGGQPTPRGTLVIAPVPVPFRVTVSVTAVLNAAVTVVAPPIVTTHDSVPEHPPPLQPVNTLPAAGVATSVACAPEPNTAEQALPQRIPAGADTTVPVPVPVRLTVSRKDWLVSTIRWSVPSLPEP